MSRALTFEEILEIIRNHKKELRERFAVKRIGVFGSFVKGTATKGSDVDFFVEFRIEELTFDKFLALIDFLEALTGRKVDIITRDGLKTIRVPQVKEDIERNIIYV